MNSSIKIGGTTTAAVAFQDPTGAPGTITGLPVWTVAPSGIVSAALAADGMSAVLTGIAAGSATVTVNAVGAEPITLEGTVNVAADVASGPTAVAGTLTFNP